MSDYIVETFQTSLAYSETEDYGNANAGQDLAASLNAAGSVILAPDGGKILGTLQQVLRNGTCSVKVKAGRMKFVAGAEAIAPGDSLIGAGNGQVKAGVAASTNARGYAYNAVAASNAGTKFEALL